LFILPIADTHTGSIYGLHPYYVNKEKDISKKGEWITVDEAGGWYYTNNPNYHLNAKQVRIWRHYEKGIRGAAAFRFAMNADLLIIVMGDAIDGDHHATHQLTTRNEGEQIAAHVQIMRWTNEVMGFRPGVDKIAYIEGTESHTRDNEEIIAQWLVTEKFKDGSSCTPFLEMDVQGNLLWFYHHGKAAGYASRSGKQLYSYLSDIYVDRRMNSKRPPNLIMTADKHAKDYQTYRHNGHELHGIILPPFQDKTRFTNKLPNAIVQTTRIGFSPVFIKDGKINRLDPFLQEMPLNEVLTW